MHVGYGLALGPTIKKTLCHTCPLGGAVIKYRRSISVLAKQYVTSYLFYVTLSFFCNIISYLISMFAFSLVNFSVVTTQTKTRESSMSYYLPIAERRTDGFVAFLRALVQSEVKSVRPTIYQLSYY